MTDTVAIAIGKQSGFDSGTTSSAPTMQVIRHTSDNLDNSGQLVSASEYGASPEPTVASQGGLTGQGSISGLLRVGTSAKSAWEAFWQGALFTDSPSLLLSDGTAPITNISAVSSGNKFTGTSIESGVTAGEWGYTTGFPTNAVNNGMFKAFSTGSNEVTVVGGTLVDEGPIAGAQVEWATEIIPGDTLSYWTVEKAYTDAAGATKYARFLNCVPNLVEFSATQKGPIQMRVGFVSSPGRIETSQVQTGANLLAAESMDPLTFIDNFVTLVDGDGTAYNTPLTCIRGWTLRIQNGAFGAECLESVSPYAFGKGDIGITGSVSLAFQGGADAALFNKLYDNTVSAVAFGAANSTLKRGLLAETPEVTYNAGSLPSSKGQVNTVDLQFGAKKESGGTSVKLCRFENA